MGATFAQVLLGVLTAALAGNLGVAHVVEVDQLTGEVLNAQGQGVGIDIEDGIIGSKEKQEVDRPPLAYNLVCEPIFDGELICQHRELFRLPKQIPSSTILM